jgi:hypothetical protein
MRLQKIIIELSSHHYIAFLPILFATLIFIYYTLQITRGRISGKWFWVAAIIFIFFTRSADFFQETRMNPDEEQWLVTANSIIDSPDKWLKSFALLDFTRIFTVLPLVTLSVFRDSLSYDDARLINLILFLLFTWVQFRTIKLCFNRETAIFTTSFILIFFAISFSWDFISYNSEMPAIVLISLAFYLLIRDAKNVGGHKSVFLMGLSTAFIFFAKEQALPVSALLVLFASFHFIRNKNYHRLVLFYLGGLLGLLLIFIPLIIIYGADGVIWNFQNMIEYSRHGLTMSAANKDKNYLSSLLDIILLNKEYFVFSLLAFISIIIQLSLLFKNGPRNQMQFFQIACLLLTVVTLYIIYLPGNFFFHYTIFLFVPFGWLLAWLYFKFIPEKKKTLAIAAILSILVISKVYDDNLRLLYPLSEFISPIQFPQEDTIYRLIHENSAPGDGMMIWGWENSYFVSSGLKRTTRFHYPVFATGYFSGKKRAVDLYIKDIREQKPEIIIELVGENRFFFDDKEKYSIEKSAPELMKIIDQNYNNLAEDSNYVFYRKKI